MYEVVEDWSTTKKMQKKMIVRDQRIDDLID